MLNTFFVKGINLYGKASKKDYKFVIHHQNQESSLESGS